MVDALEQLGHGQALLSPLGFGELRFGYVPEGQVLVATARWCPSESCLVCVGIVRSFWLLIGGGMLWPWNPSCPWWPWVWGYNDCWSWSVRVALPVLHHPHVVWMFRLVDRRFFFHGRFSFRVPRAYEFVIGVVALVGHLRWLCSRVPAK